MSANNSPADNTGEILEYLRLTCGFYFSSGRLSQIEDAIKSECKKNGITDPKRYLVLLKSQPEMLDDLVAKITVQESYFFRDNAHFKFVAEQIIPEIMNLRGDKHSLRVWSAGCASGEEVYSLAILLEQHWKNAHLIGTDISRPALSNAKAAVYRPWSFRQSDQIFVDKYFDKREQDYHLKRRICEMARFEYLNLVQDTYPSVSRNIWAMDMIFCRNVLIYIDQKLLPDIAIRFFNTLAEGGWLITGPSDPVLSSYAEFETVLTKFGILYRRPLSDVSASLLRPAEKYHYPEQFKPLPVVKQNLHVTSNTLAKKVLPAASTKKRQPEAKESFGDAKQSFAAGDYARTISLTRKHLKEDIESCLLYLRALANIGDVEKAASEAAILEDTHPFSTELHYIRAILLMTLNRWTEAIAVLKKVIYLDSNLAMAHFSMGLSYKHLDKKEQALKAFRNVDKLCLSMPGDERLTLGDGETAGRLARLAAIELNFLGDKSAK